MTDTSLPRYRSTMAVSERVDRAWQHGYEAGKAERRNVALLAIVGGIVIAARRHKIHPSWVIPALFVVIPAVATFLIVRAIIRHHRTTQAPRPTTVKARNGDEPF